MADGLKDHEEQFLKTALENNLLTNARVHMLKEEKFFYPDKSIVEVAVAKGFLSPEQVASVNQLMLKPKTAPVEAKAVEAAASPPKPVAPGPASPAPPSPTPPTSPLPPQAAAPRQEAHAAPAASVPTPPRPASAPPPAAPRPAAAAQPGATNILKDPQIATFTKLEQYLAFARAKQISDLHISTGYPPFARRYGRFVFFDRPVLKSEEVEALLFPILSEARQKRLREHLNLECAIDIEGQGRFRTTMIRQQLGWDGTFRIVNSKVPTIQELGLPEAVLKLADYRQGMILVTGPGGCGKTSTMAAMVDHVNATRHEHILTLEQPIEYVITPKQSQVNQRQIGQHSESYQRALRAALREDPDVILLGEMRDLETISMAITAAETGHLIFGTLHTTTAARTISRILDSYPPSQQPQIRTMMSESLRGVICQQLVPRCDREGVAMACEILVVTPGIASLIREMKIHQIASQVQTGKRLGMQRMEDSLMELYNQGIITIEDACARAEDKRSFLPLLG